MSWTQVYKHVGWHRRPDGSGADARKHVANVIQGLVARLLRAPYMRREEFVTASNAIIVGVGSYYGAALWGSFAWADAVEAKWRAVFRLKYDIARGSPRAWFYAVESGDPDRVGPKRAHGEGLGRVHLHTVMAASLYAQMCRSLGEHGDSEARALSRSAVALEAFR